MAFPFDFWGDSMTENWFIRKSEMENLEKMSEEYLKDIREEQLIIVQKYIFDLQKYKRKITNVYAHEFYQASYEKWAANEVYEYIKKQPKRCVIYIVEEFIEKMNNMACIPGESFMFSVAADTAVDILDQLMCTR